MSHGRMIRLAVGAVVWGAAAVEVARRLTA
jgi:hypothetical protein